MKVELTKEELNTLNNMLSQVTLKLRDADKLLTLWGKIKDALQDKPGRPS